MGILKSLTRMGGLGLASKAVKKGKVPALMFGIAGAAVAKKKAPKDEPQQRAAPATYSSAWDEMAAADQRASKSMLARSGEGDEQQEALRIKKMRERRLSGQQG